MILPLLIPCGRIVQGTVFWLIKTGRINPRSKTEISLFHQPIEPRAAIQEYLLDQVSASKTAALESIDELLKQTNQTLERARPYQSWFTARCNEADRSGMNPASYLRDMQEHAVNLVEKLLASRDRLERYRGSVLAYYESCYTAVRGFDKTLTDRERAQEFQVFAREASALPAAIEDRIVSTTNAIMQGAISLQASLANLQCTAAVHTAAASVPDASFESLKQLEQTIEECVSLGVPNIMFKKS